MADIVERFEKKARFEDESEAELIREKLEQFVTNILAEVKKRDKRFQSTLIRSGSVYEGAKVCKPDEFDFMIRIDSLTDKPIFRPCDKGEGYVKLFLDEQGWEEFKDEEGFFNPHMLSRFFKKLVNASLNDAELPEGLAFEQVGEEMYGTWWPVYSELLGNVDGQESSSVMYSESHGPATTLTIYWQGGDRMSYRNLAVSVDLTLTLGYQKSKLPVELTKLSQKINPILQNCGFHVVPAGFDSWRISFSMAEKEILASSPDGFKTCYRVLKVMRDEISESVGWDSSLIPSYMLKTVLFTVQFQTDRDLWDEEFKQQRIFQALELALQGVKTEKISNFFIAKQNLLTVADHENKLRQCVLEDMLNQMKGLKLAHTPEDAKEKKQQVRVLQMIDWVDFIISCLLAGKNVPTALWNKMFENIGNVPVGRGDGARFMSQLTNLNTTELDVDTYFWLNQIWNVLEDFFKKLLTTLEGELNLIALKFYIRTCEKKKKFESENNVLSEQVVQIFPRDFVFVWFHERVHFYTERENTTVPNIRKVVPHEFIPSGLLQGIADVTVKKGSDKGRALLKQSLIRLISMVPDDYIMASAVDYVSQLILHSKEVMKQKLEYITIPELDLD